jgi:hypothetical protein
MKIDKIYLDMDGVLCDFHKRYHEMFHYEPGGEGLENERDRKEFSPNWKKFIETKQFATLDWFPGGKELIQYVDSLGVQVEILSSSGGIRNHTEVRDQKTEWLRNNGLNYPVNIVPGRRIKKYFSYHNNVLIDDTLDVIESFNEGPGVAILHKDVNVTIQELQSILNK